jgi:Zn-dependent protease
VEDPASLPVSPPDAPVRRRWLLPAFLFVATCLSTFWAGATGWVPYQHFGELKSAAHVVQDYWRQEGVATAFEHASQDVQMSWRLGFLYMTAAMGILLTHEMGHFLVTLRHRVPATLPLFIPMPVVPFGTFGAVIGIDRGGADRRKLFDLGIAGPLAGLAVTIPVLWLGIRQLQPASEPAGGGTIPCPLVLQCLLAWLRPDYAHRAALQLSQFGPLLMAGWLGLLVTRLNMLPMSQLDGGHVSYALLGRRAHWLARGLLFAGIAVIVVYQAYNMVIMLVLIVLLGVDHPATAADDVPLGWKRRLLGWLSLAIPLLCFPWGLGAMR